MAVYTHLSLDEVSALLARFGLPPARALHGIAAGSINTNYFVDTDGGERFFLRLSEVASEADLRYEAALLVHLAGAGVATPRLVRASDGAWYAPLRAKWASLFRFVAGDERTASSASAADLEALGAAQARLHAATTAFTERRPHAFELDSVTRWVHEIAWRNGPGARPRGLPTGVIHGDLFPDNVKFDAHGGVALIFDFEMASDGVLVYDLAVTLNSWCFERAYDFEKARAFVRGYQGARPLTPDERAAIYGEARQSALRFMVTRIRDFHLRPVPAGDRVEKDFRDYQRRLEALRSLGAPGFVSAVF